MHQFRTRPFKPFLGDEPKTHLLFPLAHGFLNPLFYPKIFPSCLPPSPHFLLTPFPKLERAP